MQRFGITLIKRYFKFYIHPVTLVWFKHAVQQPLKNVLKVFCFKTGCCSLTNTCKGVSFFTTSQLFIRHFHHILTSETTCLAKPVSDCLLYICIFNKQNYQLTSIISAVVDVEILQSPFISPQSFQIIGLPSRKENSRWY